MAGDERSPCSTACSISWSTSLPGPAAVRRSSPSCPGRPEWAKPRWPCTRHTRRLSGARTGSSMPTCGDSGRRSRPSRPRYSARLPRRPSAASRRARPRGAGRARRALTGACSPAAGCRGPQQRAGRQVRLLLPGTGPAVVLITSRHRLSGLAVTAAAQLLSLQVMTTDDAAELLALRLGRHRVGAEPEAVATVISRCARLPLALAIAAAAKRPRNRISPGGPAPQLRGTKDVLGVLGADDATDLRTVSRWSYRTLNPAAAGSFWLLAVHPGPDFTMPAAASLGSHHAGQERHHHLAELVRASLISEHTPGRYQSHDLLRSLRHRTRPRRRTDDQQDRRSASCARTGTTTLHSAHAAERLLGPQLIDPPGRRHRPPPNGIASARTCRRPRPCLGLVLSPRRMCCSQRRRLTATARQLDQPHLASHPLERRRSTLQRQRPAGQELGRDLRARRRRRPATSAIPEPPSPPPCG